MKKLRLSVLVFLAAAQLGAAFGFATHCGVGTARLCLRPSRIDSPKTGADGRVTALTGTAERGGPLAASTGDETPVAPTGRDSGLSKTTPIKTLLEKDEMLLDEGEFIEEVQKKCGKKLGVLLPLTEEELDLALTGQAIGNVKRLKEVLTSAAPELNVAWPPPTPATALQVSTATAQAPPARELLLNDFLSPTELKNKKPHAMAGQPVPDDEPEFVGSDDTGAPWLESALRIIAPRIEQTDGTTRVPPGTLVGCSRVGKTRSLMEIGEKLRNESKVVIFVSFNDMTSYADGEASSRLESLLARIAYAIAKEDATSGMSLHDDTTESPTLRFNTTKKAVLDWLEENKDNDIVLLMDELNKCIKPGVDGCTDVVRFLKDHFIKPKGRYYAFTTHVSSTSKVVRMLGNTSATGSSDRDTEEIGTPYVSTQEQRRKLTGESGPHPAWYGFSAGLMYEDSRSDVLLSKWRDAFENLAGEAKKQGLQPYDIILLDLFFPQDLWDPALVAEVEQFARVLTIEAGVRRRSWAPMALHRVLGFCAQEETARKVQKLLETLQTTKVGSGIAWEVAVACALVLRSELLRTPYRRPDTLYVQNTKDPSTAKVPILPAGLIDCMTSDQSDRRVKWSTEQPHSGLNKVLEDLTSYRNVDSQPVARLVYPVTDGFQTYDLFLAYYPADGGPGEIFGYQCKKGKDMDLGEPDPRVDRSFLVRGDAAEKPRANSAPAKSGWIVVSKSECLEFMGPTLWPILKFEGALPPCGKDTTAS